MSALDDLLKAVEKPAEAVAEAVEVIPEEVAEEAPVTIEVSTKTRPSKAAEQKATIAALEAIKNNLDQLTERQAKLRKQDDNRLDGRFESL